MKTFTLGQLLRIEREYGVNLLDENAYPEYKELLDEMSKLEKKLSEDKDNVDLQQKLKDIHSKFGMERISRLSDIYCMINDMDSDDLDLTINDLYDFESNFNKSFSRIFTPKIKEEDVDKKK